MTNIISVVILYVDTEQGNKKKVSLRHSYS